MQHLYDRSSDLLVRLRLRGTVRRLRQMPFPLASSLGSGAVQSPMTVRRRTIRIMACYLRGASESSKPRRLPPRWVERCVNLNQMLSARVVQRPSPRSIRRAAGLASIEAVCDERLNRCADHKIHVFLSARILADRCGLEPATPGCPIPDVSVEERGSRKRLETVESCRLFVMCSAQSGLRCSSGQHIA
jgi:hypothetical protein